MGVSSDGLLVFGIDLGEELPEFLEDFDGEFDSFVDSLNGLPQYGELDHDWNKTWEFRQKFPVDLVLYCSYDYPMYILAIRNYEYHVSRGYTEEILCEDLKVPQELINEFKAFCQSWNIEYKEPKWLLASMYG